MLEEFLREYFWRSKLMYDFNKLVGKFHEWLWYKMNGRKN